MLWPSASTVADGGLSVNVMPFVVIVDDVMKPLYVAVTVELPSVDDAGAVYVTAMPLAELAAEPGDTDPPPVFVIVALALLIAPPDA
ncbi:MAG: hypothetical protein AUH18_03695 [Candidatus Rokubacteria bacterium 13_2_20CM_69_10]|nr:MAG: hypothetical protein AUH18_03695 [Candidatus Rokubacteria bacterium 13_2_20CM_69_10]